MEQKLCQSCAMPLTDVKLFGTEKDGNRNEDYCTYCYSNGAFSTPDQTMEQMIDTCIPFMVEQGMDKDDSRKSLESLLPNLKRWKK